MLRIKFHAIRKVVILLDSLDMLNMMQYYIDTLNSEIGIVDRETELFISGMQYITDLMKEQETMINKEGGILQ